MHGRLTFKLASKCLLMIFGVNTDDGKRIECLKYLDSWAESLPRELQHPTSNISLQSGFWTAVLHLYFWLVSLALLIDPNSPSLAIPRFFYAEMPPMRPRGWPWELFPLVQLSKRFGYLRIFSRLTLCVYFLCICM